MKLLAIDTSGDVCSASLLVGAEIEQQLERAPRRHGELLLSMIEELLAHAGVGVTQLDALAFGCGPGSFTGLRIATSVVQGVAFGADLPAVPVSTLAALAQGHHRSSGATRVLAAFDARMGELYWGAYLLGDGDLMRPAAAEEVASPVDVTLPEDSGWSGIGSGWDSYGDVLRGRLGSRLTWVVPDAYCESRDVAILAAAELSAGRSVAAERALPIYLRERVTATG